MYLVVVTVSWLYTYHQSYCAKYIKYINPHILVGKQKLNKLTIDQKALWQKVNNDKMFHHAALQRTPLHNLSYLNTGSLKFSLITTRSGPPTHGTCCTVKHHLNKPRLETKFGARPTGFKGHCFI